MLKWTLSCLMRRLLCLIYVTYGIFVLWQKPTFALNYGWQQQLAHEPIYARRNGGLVRLGQSDTQVIRQWMSSLQWGRHNDTNGCGMVQLQVGGDPNGRAVGINFEELGYGYISSNAGLDNVWTDDIALTKQAHAVISAYFTNYLYVNDAYGFSVQVPYVQTQSHWTHDLYIEDVEGSGPTGPIATISAPTKDVDMLAVVELWHESQWQALLAADDNRAVKRQVLAKKDGMVYGLAYPTEGCYEAGSVRGQTWHRQYTQKMSPKDINLVFLTDTPQ